MKRTLYLKLIVGYLIFILLSFLSVTVFMYQRSYQEIQKQEASNLYREANAISETYAVNYFSHALTMEEFQLQLAIQSTYNDTAIWIVDVKGNVLLDSSHRFSSGYMIKDFDILDFGNQYYMIGDFYGSFSEKTLSVFTPITVGYKVRGYVLIHKPMQNLINTANNLTVIGYQTLGFIALAALLVLILFTLVIFIPIRKIISSVNNYMQGNFDTPIEVPSNDEIGYLAASINYMATELHTLEDDQKKFISNVSHDFRSPLTSIKGYVEAMLDGTIPVEIQEKYSDDKTVQEKG